jgi:hypothetical protein
MQWPEVSGVEFDWFAHDRAGRVALFCSGGSAQVPPIMAECVAAIEALRREIGIGYESLDAGRAARAGFYVYDVDINGGPYRQIARPREPRIFDELPDPHRSLVARVLVEGFFERLRRIPCDLFRS